VTGPVVLAAAAAPACREAVAVALEADAPLASVLPQIEGLKGVEAARALARTYAADAVAALAPLPDSEEKRALARMALYVAQDDQVGLQREKYIQAEAKRVRLHAA
jgi:geranylgeranyl pyrophosphate synthase